MVLGRVPNPVGGFLLKHLLWILTFCSPTLAVIEVGEEIPTDQCYELTGEQAAVCIMDGLWKIQVLIHNAGWCGPCNAEMDEIADLARQYQGKPVRFISISGAGWSQGSAPNEQFLGEWVERHNIPTDRTDFIVTGKRGYFGQAFTSSPYIPNLAILDQVGILVKKGTGSEVPAYEVRETIDDLLASVGY